MLTLTSFGRQTIGSALVWGLSWLMWTQRLVEKWQKDELTEAEHWPCSHCVCVCVCVVSKESKLVGRVVWLGGRLKEGNSHQHDNVPGK